MGLYQSEMNTLVITYNVEDVNIIDYDPVLYLVKDITKNIRSKLMGRHVSVANEEYPINLIQQTEKYFKHFHSILFLDNSYQYEIKNICIDDSIPSDWIIIGNSSPERWKDGKFFPSFYNTNKLMVNCESLNKSVLDSLYCQEVGDIFFPYFSRIRYTHYDRVFDKACRGITKKPEKCENILL